MRILVVFAVYISLIGCVIAEKSMNGNGDNLIDALIIGSYESPDPVLERVRNWKKMEL